MPFSGFHSPNYTNVPDELFDELMADLSGAELKVLLYIIRRTFGFKKTADDISLSQIASGITTDAGRVLDHGTGLSQSTVQLALKSLTEKNAIVATRRSSLTKGNLPTTYSLKLLDPTTDNRQTPSTDNRQRGVPEIGEALHRESVTQETAKQKTVKQKTDDSKPSNDPPITKQLDEPRLLYSTPISQLATDLSLHFHDTEHEKSNRTRALRLWVESGLDEQTFIDMMYEARSITQKRLVKKDATAGQAGTKNKMPYWFRVLEDLTTMAEEE